MFRFIGFEKRHLQALCVRRRLRLNEGDLEVRAVAHACLRPIQNTNCLNCPRPARMGLLLSSNGTEMQLRGRGTVYAHKQLQRVRAPIASESIIVKLCGYSVYRASFKRRAGWARSIQDPRGPCPSCGNTASTERSAAGLGSV
jgi:hypothetical protein